MKNNLVYLALIIIGIKFSESCELLKFKHKSGKPDFYEKLEGKLCNGEPIFKMLGDAFFIYKLPNSHLWCESYTPSMLVICHAECDEIRFDIQNLYSQEGIIPEEYNGHLDEWIQLTDEKITCNDHEVLQDVFVHDSPVNIANMHEIQKEFEKVEEVTEEPEDKHEKKLDLLLENVRKIQEKYSLDFFNPTTTTTTTPSNLENEDNYILSMIEFLPKFEKERMSKIQNRLEINMTTSTMEQTPTFPTIPTTTLKPLISASRFITPNVVSQESSIKKTSSKEDNLSAFLSRVATKENQGSKTSVKKQDILNNRDNSCIRIALRVFDDSWTALQDTALTFDLMTDVNCLNYPVYKADRLFLYRNVFGEWCQKEMESFQSSTECFRKCKTILLGPAKIKSPIETTVVTVFAHESDQVTATFVNHRYVCKTFHSCETVTCQNGGECVPQTMQTQDPSKFTCKCPPYSTGQFCEEIVDQCYSSPCQNDGECSSKPFQIPTCACQEGYYGQWCEKKRVECKYNPCQNGGRCVHQLSATKFMCTCTPEFKGDYCESPALDVCRGKSFGENIPHPDDTKLFLVCLQNNRYRISPCPKGLVFNPYLNRCDYNTEKSVINKNQCSDKPCLNDGTCLPVFNSTIEYVCECKTGFQGARCEENIDDCSNHMCGENNQCVDLINDYVCICDNYKFYGDDCGERKVVIPCKGRSNHTTHHSYPFRKSVIVECDNNGRLTVKSCPPNLVWSPYMAACTYARPKSLEAESFFQSGLPALKCLNKDCQNNAKCVLNESEEAVCVCEPGYEGDLCELNIDECASNPCMNNGRCVDGVNQYYCVCENNFIDSDCCCTNANNPCTNVLNEFQFKKDKTVRYHHPFTKEKFIVCNLEGYAQVLECPEGLVWKQDEETCALKNDQIDTIYKKFCNDASVEFRLTYPYSGLKYAVCQIDGYGVEECPKETPYFCTKNSSCVKNLNLECKNTKRY